MSFFIVIVISILLALYLLDNPGLATKCRKENCSGQINNPNEPLLANQKEPYASFNPSQADGLAGHANSLLGSDENQGAVTADGELRRENCTSEW